VLLLSFMWLYKAVCDWVTDMFCNTPKECVLTVHQLRSPWYKRFVYRGMVMNIREF
jgi:hypothetical protein